MRGADMAVTTPRVKRPLGQYFTPRHVARFMAHLATAPAEAAVLEPCAGEGVFIDVLEERGYGDITAYEIDSAVAQRHLHPIIAESFVSAEPGRLFSLIIGNPPYIRWRDLPQEQKEELQANHLWRSQFNSLSDYLTFFIAKSVTLLAPGGELILVTPSYWMHTMHSADLRELMLRHGFFDTIVHFEEATVFDGVASSILIFKYVRADNGCTPPSIRLVRYRGPRRVQLPQDNLEGLVEDSLFDLKQIPHFKPRAIWTLADSETQDQLDRLESACRRPTQKQLTLVSSDESVARLGDVADIANGMVSGADAAFRLSSDIDLTPAEVEASIPVAKGAHLRPFYISKLTRYIFLPLGLSEADVCKHYPNFYRQLSESRTRLEDRYSYGRDLPFWEWAFLRSYAFFRDARHLILVPCKERISHKDYVRFAMASDGTYPTQDVTAIQVRDDVREDPYYILALLNSREVFEWIRYRGLMKGAVAEFSERPLAAIPIRLIDWDNTLERKRHDAIAMNARLYVANPADGQLRQKIAAAVSELLAS
jgi:adenine-specific DNA-methyltransferase